MKCGSKIAMFSGRAICIIGSLQLALLDGFGRMGHNAHWFSDVVGAGLLGVGTTELLFWLHREHQQHPSRFRIFPVTAPADRHGQHPSRPAGLGLAFTF
jgi:membrane-associated phospholipid phosphatase